MNFKSWIEGVIPIGDCFRFANQLALEMHTDGVVPVSEIFVVHATVNPKWHPRSYPHAWVEAQGRCYDWQLSKTKVGSLLLKDYYEEYAPTNIKKYTPTQSIRNMVKQGHHGPW